MHYNFYIQKELQELFSKETNKSTLINDLLKQHYNVATEPTLRQSKPKPVKETKIETIKAKIPGMITAADLTPKIQERGTCRKCGSILDTRGACLNKKC
jgi:Tfp pilus assembly protein PilO